MTPASAEDIVRRLYGLILVEDRLGPERAREVHRYIEVDEYALALEAIAGRLGHVRAAITDQERDDKLALARQMKISDFVSRTLESCPRATCGQQCPCPRVGCCLAERAGRRYSGLVQQPLRPVPTSYDRDRLVSCTNDQY
jgi:hypothetical protein